MTYNITDVFGNIRRPSETSEFWGQDREKKIVPNLGLKEFDTRQTIRTYSYVSFQIQI